MANEPSAAQRKLFAKMGYAMPDGSFYIRPLPAGKDDLENAIKAVGRGEQGGTSGASIRKHIMTRAANLKLSSEIPNTWNPDGTLKEVAQSSMTVGELLEHHGVKGMHWGVRKSSVEEGASRAAHKVGVGLKKAGKVAGEHKKAVVVTALIGNAVYQNREEFKTTAIILAKIGKYALKQATTKDSPLNETLAIGRQVVQGYVVHSDLEHHGVKGMKWGVRQDRGHEGDKAKTKTIAKADAAFETPSTKTLIEINNKVAGVMNNVEIPRINGNPKYKNADFSSDSPLRRQYYSDYASAMEKHLNEAADSIGTNASGTRKYSVVVNHDDLGWGVQAVDVKHSDDDSPTSFTVTPKLDAKGHILSISFPDPTGMRHGIDGVDALKPQAGDPPNQSSEASDHDMVVQAAEDHEAVAAAHVTEAKKTMAQASELMKSGLDSPAAKSVYGDNASKQGDWEFRAKNAMSKSEAIAKLHGKLSASSSKHLKTADKHKVLAQKLRTKASSMAQDGLNFDPNFDIDVYLSHFGVKGMHWGVRKERGEPSADHVRVSELRSKVNSGRGVHVLSNDELQDVNNRLNLETNYARLVNGGGNAIDDGEKFVKGSLSKVKLGIDAIETGQKAIKIYNAVKK